MDVEKSFLAILAAFLVFLSFLMLTPFIGYILAAVLLAFVMKPLQKRIEPYTGPNIASALLIILFVAAVLAPFGIAVNAVIGDAQTIVDSVGDTDVPIFSDIEQSIAELIGQDIDLDQELQNVIERFSEVAVGGIAQIIDIVTGLMIGLLVMVFALFYLLKDGEKLHRWLMSVTPVSQEIQDELYAKANFMTRSVLKGHVLVAIIEGLIGGLGLWLAGVPNVAFWTFIMIILCFIPVVGAFLVWAPAALYLFFIGEVNAAIFLTLYGSIVVSLADNLLRPYLVDPRAEIHPGAVLIGVIGGIYVFGAVGLFIGPVVFGFSKTVLDVLMKERDEFRD